jgi:hypothetical protein
MGRQGQDGRLRRLLKARAGDLLGASLMWHKMGISFPLSSYTVPASRTSVPGVDYRYSFPTLTVCAASRADSFCFALSFFLSAALVCFACFSARPYHAKRTSTRDFPSERR